jgi:hypothetical protein
MPLVSINFVKPTTIVHGDGIVIINILLTILSNSAATDIIPLTSSFR